jgi:DNA segregation ATPase FtsK/SpoIIIE-like protein
MMEADGIVSKANHVGKREVLWWEIFLSLFF